MSDKKRINNIFVVVYVVIFIITWIFNFTLSYPVVLLVVVLFIACIQRLLLALAENIEIIEEDDRIKEP